MILLDYRDKRPIYEQVVEKLERLIVSGGLEPLTKMPSVRSLAMELSVNPNTIQRAYAQLEQDGYLYTVSGRGSFVTAENEWRENKQGKVLKEWRSLTLEAKETGITQERLSSILQQVYESGQETTLHQVYENSRETMLRQTYENGQKTASHQKYENSQETVPHQIHESGRETALHQRYEEGEA